MRFQLTQADFGGKVTQTIITDMVAVYDTTVTLKETGNVDTTGRKPLRFVTERVCDKPLGDLKGKIALMDLNKDCDISLMALRVQKAGAKAFVVVHNSNSNGNIKLPKQGVKKDSVTIPIFTIGKEKGDSIRVLLPGVVGIKGPDVPVLTGGDLAVNPETLHQQDKLNNAQAAAARETAEGETADDALNLLTNTLKRANFVLSPNPTKDMAYLQYALPRSADMLVEVKNNLGQVVYAQQLRGVQIGTLELNTQGWSNNVYVVELTIGKEKIRRKLAVQR
jgi:hypothetical protein